ncbi:MAG: CobD/CbiB family protein [Azoarcus sp.]|jgi:adenosylcobinamide-phosphate synthase|nr:CobD/CbiB family protein [Azoarcus sp.]
MKLLSLIVVLLLEQLRPLPVDQVVLGPLRTLAGALPKRGGEQLGWALLVAGGALVVALIDSLLPGLLAAVFGILVLYLTLGFRHESHYFTNIHLSLRTQELGCARELLTRWRGGQYDDADADEVARLAIEQALVSAHRCVFGAVFWFMVLGPCGAVMYRLARFLHDEWGGGERRDEPPPVEAGVLGNFGRFSRQAFMLIDWLPARMTAILFAIGGNFEDAVFCWRAQSVLWPERGNAVLVCAGAGALGLKLGQGSVPAGEGAENRGAENQGVENLEVGVGEKAGVGDMQATVGLVWRALIVCLAVLALTTIAVVLGK